MNKIRRSEFDTTDEQVKVINNIIDLVTDLSECVDILVKKPAKKKPAKKKGGK